MKNKLVFAVVLMMFSFSAAAEKVFWSIEARGAFIKSFGHSGLIVVDGSPVSPNPSNRTWDSSCGNTLYFHKTEDGSVTPEWMQSEMIRLANTASVGGYKIRVGVYKVPGDNYCYTSQIWSVTQ